MNLSLVDVMLSRTKLMVSLAKKTSITCQEFISLYIDIRILASISRII